MLNTTTIFGMIALFAVGMIISPLAASAVVPYPDYLDIKKVIVNDDGKAITDIIYKIGGFLPHYETVKPFGYGVITKVGTEFNVIATTSHAGLLDAEAQEGDANNPILHNHYAVLGSNPTACGMNPSIVSLTEDEFGEVVVKGKTIIVKDLLPSVPVDSPQITPGNDIEYVASFQLKPVGSAVCVIPVEKIDKRTIIFEDFKPDYLSPGYENRDEGYGNGYEYPNEMSYDEEYDEEYDYNQRY